MIRYSDNSSKSTLDTAVVSLQMTLDSAIYPFYIDIRFHQVGFCVGVYLSI